MKLTESRIRWELDAFLSQIPDFPVQEQCVDPCQRGKQTYFKSRAACTILTSLKRCLNLESPKSKCGNEQGTNDKDRRAEW